MYVDLLFCSCSFCVSCIILFFFRTTQLHSQQHQQEQEQDQST